MRIMKDSGIPWLGQIPKDWKTKRIGLLYVLRNEKVSDKDFSPLSVTMKGILPQLETAAKTNDGDNRKLVRKGDFVINSRSDRRGSCGISSLDGSVSLINIVLSPCEKIFSNFYNWLFHTSLFADEFYKWGHGIVDDLWTTRWSEMKNIHVPCPPLIEQERIAKFLDKKCADIDEMIDLEENMIGKLQEYKQAVITETVTKGLNPNVPMKDSGILWLGQIPKHWVVCKIKNIATLWGRIGFRGYTSEDICKEDDGAITLSPSNMQPMKMDFSKLTYINWNKYYESPEIMISKGDILMVKTGSSYGKVAYVEELPKEATINPQILRIVPSINSKYLCYYMQTTCFTYQVKIDVVGGTIPTISQEKIKFMRLPLPPLSEQQSIADFLDKKCDKIDALIEVKQKKITKLKEYKKSVIYEYVTGKKEIN